MFFKFSIQQIQIQYVIAYIHNLYCYVTLENYLVPICVGYRNSIHFISSPEGNLRNTFLWHIQIKSEWSTWIWNNKKHLNGITFGPSLPAGPCGPTDPRRPWKNDKRTLNWWANVRKRKAMPGTKNKIYWLLPVIIRTCNSIPVKFTHRLQYIIHTSYICMDDHE